MSRKALIFIATAVTLAACSNAGESGSGGNLTGSAKSVELRRRDFDWKAVPEARPYRRLIVAAANGVLRSDTNCISLAPHALAVDKDLYSKASPVFQLTCATKGPKAHVVRIDVRAIQAAANAEAPTPLDQAQAMLLCRRAVETRTTHPLSIEFVSGDAFDNLGERKAHFATSFTAQNSFGVRDQFRAHCFFEGERLTRSLVRPEVG